LMELDTEGLLVGITTDTVGETLGEGDTLDEGEEEPVGALLVALEVGLGVEDKFEEALAPSTEVHERVRVEDEEMDWEGVVERVEDLLLDPEALPPKGVTLGVVDTLGRTPVSVRVMEGDMEPLEVGV
jgi:hypothetical protein